MQVQVHGVRSMNDIRSVDFSDAQFKSLLFEVYSAGFGAGYSRCTDIHTGFNTWYHDVIQKDNLPVYAALDSTNKDVQNAMDSVLCINQILYSGRYESIRPQIEYAVKVLKDFIIERC